MGRRRRALVGEGDPRRWASSRSSSPGRARRPWAWARTSTTGSPRRAPSSRRWTRALGERLSALCFEGPEESLKLTANTQPAILTVSAAAAAVLAARGIAPDLVAGHSLGEYSALVAAGACGAAEAAKAVRARGTFMQEAVPAGRAR